MSSQPRGADGRPSLPPPPARPSKKEVADYLAQWGVEEAVQQAVNSAIQHKAADPVAHIANFLEEKGREAEAARTPPSGAPGTGAVD